MSVANLNTISTAYFNYKNTPERELNLSDVIDKEKEFDAELALTVVIDLPFAKHDVIYMNSAVPQASPVSSDDYEFSDRYYTFVKYEKCHIVFECTDPINKFELVPFHLHSTLVTQTTDPYVVSEELNKYYQNKWNITLIANEADYDGTTDLGVALI